MPVSTSRRIVRPPRRLPAAGRPRRASGRRGPSGPVSRAGCVALVSPRGPVALSPPSPIVPRRTFGPTSHAARSTSFSPLSSGAVGSPPCHLGSLFLPLLPAAEETRPHLPESVFQEGDGFRDTQHCGRFRGGLLHRVAPFRVVMRVVRVFRGAICHSFLHFPALLHRAGRQKQNRRPRLWGPPAWCRLWRRRASVNDAPRAVIPP